jgi:hypothetical protein
MAKSSREIQIEYDKENRNCHVILEAGKAIGLGTTRRDALEDLREAAHFYVDSMIDMKLREPNQVVPVEGREENGDIRTKTDSHGKY